MSDRRPAPKSAARCVTEPPLVPTGAELPVILPAKLCFLIKSIVKERLLGCIGIQVSPSPLSFSLSLLLSLSIYLPLSFALFFSPPFSRVALRKRLIVRPGVSTSSNRGSRPKQGAIQIYSAIPHCPRGISYSISFLLLLLPPLSNGVHFFRRGPSTNFKSPVDPNDFRVKY